MMDMSNLKLGCRRQFDDGKMFKTYTKWKKGKYKQPLQYNPNFVKYGNPHDFLTLWWCESDLHAVESLL